MSKTQNQGICKFNIAVLIGRFQPFHKAHLQAVQTALSQADRAVMIIGSSQTAPSYKNPWSFEQRERMILDGLSREESQRLACWPVMDRFCNEEAWVSSVIDAVQTQAHLWHLHLPSIALFGHKKDASSFYLDLFSQWNFVETGNFSGLNATQIRESLYSANPSLPDLQTVPVGTYNFLKSLYQAPDFFLWQQLMRNDFLRQHNQDTETVVDCRINQSGHICLDRESWLQSDRLSLPKFPLPYFSDNAKQILAQDFQILKILNSWPPMPMIQDPRHKKKWYLRIVPVEYSPNTLKQASQKVYLPIQELRLQSSRIVGVDAQILEAFEVSKKLNL